MEPADIAVISQPEIPDHIMEVLRVEIETGTPIAELARYVDTDDLFHQWQCKEIVKGILEGVDASPFADHDLSYQEM